MLTSLGIAVTFLAGWLVGLMRGYRRGWDAGFEAGYFRKPKGGTSAARG